MGITTLAKHLYAHLLLVGFSIFLLYHLIAIAVYGQVIITEPNPYILVGEIVLIFGIIGLGIKCAMEVNKWERQL